MNETLPVESSEPEVRRKPGRPPLNRLPDPVAITDQPIESVPGAVDSAHAPLPAPIDPTDPATTPQSKITTSPMPKKAEPISEKREWKEPDLDLNPKVQESLLAIPQQFANYINKVFKRKGDDGAKRYRVEGCSANLTGVAADALDLAPWFFEVAVFTYEEGTTLKNGKAKTRSLAVINADRVLVKPSSFKCEAETFLMHYEQE